MTMTDAAPASIDPFGRARRVVVKIGSSMVVDAARGAIHAERLAGLAADLDALWRRGCACVLVTSGAVATGRARLGLPPSRRSMAEKQACAAVGQAELMQAWSLAFAAQSRSVAQALLTLEDTERRRRWLNARATIEKLLAWGVCPIVNENDTTATDEIRYGDNDRLAARIAQMIGADILVLLSDVDGLYDADPRKRPDARRLPQVREITPDIEALAGGPGTAGGSGGMRSKIEAAKIATRAGCAVALTSGAPLAPLSVLRSGGTATWFEAAVDPLTARKQWIAGTLKPAGALVLDAGAAEALRAGKSLLPAGVVSVEGAFEKGDAVILRDAAGAEIGRGLCAYGAEEAARLKGARSADMEALIGYVGPSELVHRDDLVLAPTRAALHPSGEERRP